MLRGMVLTRATDNRLKTLFTGGEVRYGEAAFQGKGFRSLGQEAIYAAGIRLRRGEAFRRDGEWQGDVVAPVIRDLGVTLAMRPTPETVRLVLSAQMAKAGPPMDGRDLHVGDFAGASCPARRRSRLGTLTIAGMALAFARDNGAGDASGRDLVHRRGRLVARRVARGDQPVRRADSCPRSSVVENNQTALSTPVAEQSAVRVFADKARGLRHSRHHDRRHRSRRDRCRLRLGGRARPRRLGPALIELVSMRMCGHAHHDDMLYLGKDTPPTWEYPPLHAAGLRRSRSLRLLVGPRSDSRLRRAAAGGRRHRRPAISTR